LSQCCEELGGIIEDNIVSIQKQGWARVEASVRWSLCGKGVEIEPEMTSTREEETQLPFVRG